MNVKNKLSGFYENLQERKIIFRAHFDGRGVLVGVRISEKRGVQYINIEPITFELQRIENQIAAETRILLIDYFNHALHALIRDTSIAIVALDCDKFVSDPPVLRYLKVCSSFAAFNWVVVKSDRFLWGSPIGNCI